MAEKTGDPQAKPAMNSSRQKILDAVSQLIAEKGVNNTTVSDIVERAGISRGALHYYYKTKNELIYDITAKHLDHMTQHWLDELSRSDSKGGLSALFKAILEDFVHAEGPGTLNLYLIHDAVTGNELLRECFLRQYESWRKGIMDTLGKTSPDTPKENEALSYIAIALIDGLTIQWLLGMREIPFGNISDFLLD
jgi:AcrR family transcriptional regulator